MNMSNIKGLLLFGAGAVAGSFTTWYLLKEKYQNLADEEIESVKRQFGKRYEKDVTNAVKTYHDTINRYQGNEEMRSEKYEEKNDADMPYVIPPEEFGVLDDYDQISLTYYADGVLADEYDEQVEDTDETIGVDPLDHFGEYEEDSVFVRNDKLKVDYEILRDLRTYSDVLKHSPRKAEG